MADKFYRLISVLINICPEPLREIFLEQAKVDTTPGVQYTTLDAYLANMTPTIQSLKRRRKLRDDQFDLLYPSSGKADESQWDITLLVVLILELFASNLPIHIQNFIKDIREVRNSLQHTPNTSNMSDSAFTQMWARLENDTLTLASFVHGNNYENTIKQKIKEALVSNMPDLNNTLCVWFNEKSSQMKHEMDEMKATMDEMKEKINKMQEKINEVSEDTRGTKREITKSTDILENASMVKPGPAGKPNKRLKTVDKILKKMQDDFERTMNAEMQDDFTAPPEVDKMKSKLRDNRFVIVAGHNKSFYRAAALSAIQEMNYQENRCVQMHTSSDWRHVDAEDVDFVLCLDPFGRDTFDEEKSKGMADIFISIQNTVNEETKGQKLVVMMVTDIAVLDECKRKHYHEILDEVVTVYDSTSATHPADLTVARCTSDYAQTNSTVTQNLIEQTQFFLQHHDVSSKQVDPGILSTAKEKIKTHKAVVLVGPRGSGKTSLAVALATSYQPSQVLLLTNPELVKHVNVNSTNVVLIEDFAGRHKFNDLQIDGWYRTFQTLYFMKTAGKLNVIITCDKEKLEKCCKENEAHPLLEHTVELTGTSKPPKQETVDNHHEQLAENSMAGMVFPEGLNDDDSEGELSNSEETEFNIITDTDEINADDKDIPLGEYQQELAKEGSEGKNVIVMAPTNTGKTRVACRIMQVHLRRHRQFGKIGKVIFLLENEAQALQTGKVCAELLPAFRTKVISGNIQRDKNQYLKDFIDRRDILVVTAQVLLNDLKSKDIDSVAIFSMIVFDECQQTKNYHRFNEIMGHYMNLKLRQDFDAKQLPQVVGLTASLGVGGNTSHDAAMNHMKSLLANLDAKLLCTVRRNKEELRHIGNNPIEETVVAKRREDDRYGKAVLDVMGSIAKYMINHPSMQDLLEQDKFIKEACRVPASPGSGKFLNWLSELKKKLKRLRSDSLKRMMEHCLKHLEKYNKALLIHADARIKDAVKFLHEYMEDERKVTQEDDTAAKLLEFYDNLKMKTFSSEPENPKLVEMERIVMGVFAKNEDARGNIFVKTRELAQILVNWMNETQPLNSLNATEFVGQLASKAEKGLPKYEQKDVLEYFQGGRYKIIIATSVEGLHITKCNLVIRYEHVTNEIVRLKSKARARQPNSRYYVLTEEGSWIVEKEEKNALLEKVINSTASKLQVYLENNPHLWEQELRQIQAAQKQEKELKERQRLANINNGELQLKCLDCNSFICLLSDIREIQNQHHVAVAEEVTKRLFFSRNPDNRFQDREIIIDGHIYCDVGTECLRELGGVCEYKHFEFPLLKMKNFRVVNKNGEEKTFKTWKKANLQVQPFTPDDLHVVERQRTDI